MLRLCTSLLLLAIALPSTAATYTVSVLPLRGIVVELAGPQTRVDCLVGPGQSPETYEPTSRQLAQLARSSALFTIGMPFEAVLVTRLVGQFPDLRTVDSAQGIARRELPGVAATDHGHEHSDSDPHVWTGPGELRRIAANVAAALVELEPERAGAIRARHVDLDLRLATLEREIETRLAPFVGRAMLAYHPAYGYFAARYGLRQLAVESGGTEPGARHLVELAGRLRDEQVTCMFAQPQFSPDRARNLARSLGVELVVLDPLQEDVEAMLRDFATAIESACTSPPGGTR